MRQHIYSLALLVAAGACSRPEAPPQAAERVQMLELGPTADTHLPGASACVLPPLTDTSGWERRRSGASSLRVLLPPAFEPDSARMAAFIHGGQAWNDGKREIEEVYGHWSRSSFRSSPAHTECRAVLGGLPAWIIERASPDGYSVTAWIPDPAEPYDPVLRASSPDPSDRAMLLTAMQSVEWK